MSKIKTNSDVENLSWWQVIIPPSVLSIITALFYYPSLSYPFQFDDIANITKNFAIRSDSSVRFLKSRWLGEWINRANYKIGNRFHRPFDPFFYRTFNVAIHILAGVTLFYLVLSLCRCLKKENFLYKNSLLISFVTSGLFLLHPVQTQAVSYVIQARLEGLAGLFILLGMLTFVKAAKAKNLLSKILFSALMVFVAFLSCGTKEVILTSPFLLPVLDWYFVSDQTWDSFKRNIPLHLLFAVSIFGTFMYFESAKWFSSLVGIQTTNNRGNILTKSYTDVITPYHYFISEFKVILHYLMIFIWPLSLSVEYDWKLSDSIFAPDSFFPLLALLAIAAFVLYNSYHKRFRPLNFGLVWFAIAISPRASFIPSPELICDYKTYTSSAGWLFAIAVGMVYVLNFVIEKFRALKDNPQINNSALATIGLIAMTYTVFAGQIIMTAVNNAKNIQDTSLYKVFNQGISYLFHYIFILVVATIPAGIAYMIYYIHKNKNVYIYTPRNKMLFSLLFLLPFGYGAMTRNIVWSSPVEFWGDIVRKAPTKARGHNNYGVALSESGKYHESIKHYKEAIRLDDFYCDPYSNLAVAYSMLGKTNQAISALRNALRIFPNYPEAYNNLGSFLLQKKDYQGADQSFNLAIKLRPWYGKAYMNKGRLYLEKFENEKKPEHADIAWECFVKATQGDLDNSMGFKALAEAGIKLQKYKECIPALEHAVRLGDKSPQTFFSLANCYYMEKEYDKAIKTYEQLIKIDPKNPHYRYNLGETYFVVGDYNTALENFQKSKEFENSIPQTHFRIASCLEMMGNIEDAKYYLERLAGAEAPDWFKNNAKHELERLSTVKMNNDKKA